jgi:DNA uptake protein ComE-like DNA-binding protein
MKSRILALVIVAALALPLVAIADESAAPAKPAAAPTTTEHHSSKSSSKSMPKVNLNSAEKDQIAKLPGLSDELADKIVAARPYKSGSELVSKKILTQAEYNKIKSHVTCKSSTTTASAESEKK